MGNSCSKKFTATLLTKEKIKTTLQSMLLAGGCPANCQSRISYHAVNLLCLKYLYICVHVLKYTRVQKYCLSFCICTEFLLTKANNFTMF